MPAARDQMDQLLDAAIQSAILHLEKGREFYPFALALARDATVIHVNVWEGDDHPASSSLIESLRRGLRGGASAGEYLATALVCDVKLQDRSSEKSLDALQIQIEHLEAEPVTCYLPYQLEGSVFTPGQLMAERGEQIVFRRDC